MDRVDASTEWSDTFGYSRAVRRGNVIEVAGTAGLSADGVAPREAYGQAQQALETIVSAIEALGGTLEDVVRTRMFVVDIRRNGYDVGRAHGELFTAVKPATGMYEVGALIREDLLIEIEATAVLGAD